MSEMLQATAPSSLAPSIPVHPKTRPHYKRAYIDALAIQAVLLRSILDPATPLKDRAQSTLAWERLEERKRILRGKPMPGSLRPEAKAKSRARSVLPQPISEPDPLA